MKIQFNTDKTINGDERQQDFFISQISEELKRIAVTYQADTVELAVSGALGKLKTSLKTILNRIANH